MQLQRNFKMKYMYIIIEEKVRFLNRVKIRGQDYTLAKRCHTFLNIVIKNGDIPPFLHMSLPKYLNIDHGSYNFFASFLFTLNLGFLLGFLNLSF